MKIINVDKTYSWLEWPVRLKNYDHSKRKQLHITAKFFGDARINPEEVMKRVAGGQWLPRNKFEWEPTIFGDLIYVLELKKFPPALSSVHETFSILKDDFTPWRPHITVPVDYYNLVRVMNLTPMDEELRLDDLRLFVGRAAHGE